MTKEEIISLLDNEKYKPEDVENFASYCIRLKLEKDRSGQPKNKWIQNRTSKQMAILFERVAKDGLVFDGVHITLQSTGISYDYIAYKNKMFISYPESTVDVQLVYEDDLFQFAKENGKVIYQHNFSDPFNQTEDRIKGAYCIIKNKRGEFITLLSKSDIDKHRKVAKTDYIWKQWFNEMALKTVIKKACKQHFSDIFQNIETIDNDNYELENPLELDLKTKQEIDAIKTKGELQNYYFKNKGQGDAFDKYIVLRKSQLQNEQNS